MTARIYPFEGIDGSGKTTLIKNVAARLRKQGYSVLTVQEPGTTNMGLNIRKLLKSDTPRSTICELLLFEASRNDMVESVIKPAMDSYDFIFIDRFVDSTITYQGFGNGISLTTIETLNNIAISQLPITKTIYVDVKLDIAEARRKQRETDTDKFDIDREFAHRVYKGYHHIIAASPEDYHIVYDDNDLTTKTQNLVNYLTMPNPYNI